MGKSVLDQGKEKPAASVLDKKASASTGEQSVLGNSVKQHKPLTFYKKAWFWIIIAVVVIGIGALVAFLIINANLTAEAIEKYDKNADAASSAVSRFDSKFYTAYNEAGLGYYSKDNKRSVDLRNKCLEELDVDVDSYESAKDIKYYSGEKAAEEIGAGETRKLSESYEKVANNLDDISKCKDMLADVLKNDYELTIGEFTVDDEDSWWPDYGVNVKIKNKSDYSIKFYIKLKAVDTDGKTIGTDYLYTDELKPGATDDGDMFDAGFLSSRDRLKTAKFEVVEVSERSAE